MSSTIYEHKRLGYIIAELSLKGDPQALMMTQNQLKKDLVSNSTKVTSLVLTFLTENMNTELWALTGEQLLILAKGQARSVLHRVKAITAVGAAIGFSQESVISLVQALTEELPSINNKSLIYGAMGLFEVCIKHSKEMGLHTIKGVYALLDNSQNWIRMHAIKMVDKLIAIEPRMSKKVESKIYSFMVTTNAKSVECELIKLSISHFLKNEELFGLIKSKTEVFLDSEDVNLNIIGFKALAKIIAFKPSVPSEHSDKLAEKAKFENPILAKEIFSIYEANLSEEDADPFIKQLKTYIEGAKSQTYKKVLIEMLFRLILREPDVLKDLNFLVGELLPLISNSLKTEAEVKEFLPVLKKLQKKDIELQLKKLYLHILCHFFENTSPHSITPSTSPTLPLILFTFSSLSSLSKEAFLQGLLNTTSQPNNKDKEDEEDEEDKESKNRNNTVLENDANNLLGVVECVGRLRVRVGALERAAIEWGMIQIFKIMEGTQWEAEYRAGIIQPLLGKNEHLEKDGETTTKENSAKDDEESEGIVEEDFKENIALPGNELTYLLTSSSSELTASLLNVDLSELKISEPTGCDFSQDIELEEKELEILSKTMDEQVEEKKKLTL